MVTRRELLALLPAAAAAAGPGWPVGANTAVTGYELFQSIELLRSLELPSIEIHPMGRPEATPGKFPGFQWDTLDGGTRRRLKAALRPFRHITTHLPYTGLNYMASNEAERAHAVKTIETALRGSAELGATLAVLHPQGCTDAELPRYWNAFLDRFRAWAGLAQQLGVKLTLETMFPRSVRDFVRIIEETEHPNLGCTIDVGHQSRYAELVERVKPEERATAAGIRAYNDTTLAIAEKLGSARPGSKVWHYHVHDIDPATWVEHKPLIHGFVDYQRLYALMRQQEYRGVLLLEIGGAAEAMPGYLSEAKAKLEAWQKPYRD